MSSTLGHALREPELIGEAELILAAMADFGPNHRAVLETLERVPDGEACVYETLVDHVETGACYRAGVRRVPAFGQPDW